MSFLMPELPADVESVEAARRWCAMFVSGNDRRKYILGRNVYADCVARRVQVDGFVDDFASDATYRGLPVLRTTDVPPGSMVLNAAGGRPLSARRRLVEAGLDNLDYFAFFRHADLPLIELRFNEGFASEFAAHRDRYDWIHDRFHDDESRHVFGKLVGFRHDYDIRHLQGFTMREDVQYFEDFLSLRTAGEAFCDVGGFNGFTSLEFVRRCPSYRSIDIFEPEPSNHAACVAAMSGHADVRVHKCGASSRKATLFLDSRGSASRVSVDGGVSIEVDTLDHVLMAAGCRPTFVKIDTEGEEGAAIAGACETIRKFHPRLAVSVYHKAGDFWAIPEQVLSIRDDYDVYLRHYTESIYETVMFFVPRSASGA